MKDLDPDMHIALTASTIQRAATAIALAEEYIKLADQSNPDSDHASYRERIWMHRIDQDLEFVGKISRDLEAAAGCAGTAPKTFDDTPIL